MKNAFSCLAIVVVLGFAHDLCAQEGNPLIEEGIKQYNDLEYETSINTLSAALIRPGNTDGQKITIYQYLGLDYLLLGREEEAEGAFRSLLVIDENWAFDPVSTPPKFIEFFDKVKDAWIAEGKPGLEKKGPAEKAVGIKHKIPDKGKKGQEINLKMEIENPDKKAMTVTIFYRKTGEEVFEEVMASMKGYSDDKQRIVYMATIPGEAVVAPSVDYYIVVQDAVGKVIGGKGDDSAPLRIPVQEEQKKKRALLWGLLGGLGGAAVIGIVLGVALPLALKKEGNHEQPQPAQVTVVICEEGTPGC
jgi:hypothetical protein